MDNSKAVQEAVKYLKNTDEFVSLTQINNSLVKNPNINNSVRQFLKKQDSLYNNNLTQSQSQFIMEELKRDYENLSQYPEARNYFEALEKFNSRLTQFISEITNSIKLN